MKRQCSGDIAHCFNRSEKISDFESGAVVAVVLVIDIKGNCEFHNVKKALIAVFIFHFSICFNFGLNLIACDFYLIRLVALNCMRACVCFPVSVFANILHWNGGGGDANLNFSFKMQFIHIP